jgi:hypothetical protein
MARGTKKEGIVIVKTFRDTGRGLYSPSPRLSKQKKPPARAGSPPLFRPQMPQKTSGFPSFFLDLGIRNSSRPRFPAFLPAAKLAPRRPRW